MGGEATSAALYAAVAPLTTKEAQPEDAMHKSHHQKDGKGFQNPWPSWTQRSGWAIGGAMVMRNFNGKANKPDTKPPHVTVRRPAFLKSRETANLRATWLGHACYLIEFPGGLRVLFDPVFEDRCSPFSFLGPKRYTKRPCNIGDIPFVDAVVISHAHYDHLSYPTVLEIKKQHPRAHFFAPLGNKKWFQDCGIENVTELDWWDSRDLRLSPSPPGSNQPDDVTIAKEGTSPADGAITARIGCLPCQHMAARSGFDIAKTLWASWSVESGGKKVWFAGDTGYRSVPEESEGDDDYSEKWSHLPHCPAFAHIGHLRGPFDLGLIPIGAYQPRYIMSPMHANPFDSVNIFKDSRCTKALGMHWGTWVLTEEEVLEPPKLLKAALEKSKIPSEGSFDVCDIGESRDFPDLANDGPESI